MISKRRGNKTLEKITKLRAEISERQKEITSLQENCPHPLMWRVKKSGSNTGNWDPHDDCYWTDHTCEMCEKSWTEYK